MYYLRPFPLPPPGPDLRMDPTKVRPSLLFRTSSVQLPAFVPRSRVSTLPNQGLPSYASLGRVQLKIPSRALLSQPLRTLHRLCPFRDSMHDVDNTAAC